MKRNIWRRGAVIVAGCLIGILVVGVGLASAGKPPGTPGGNGKKNAPPSSPKTTADSTLYVSPSGSSGAPDKSCGSALYSRISDAVAAATSGDRIVVCPGTYHETVNVSLKSVGLLGRSATIDATGFLQGVVFMGPETAGSSLQGFTIKNADREAVYADGTSNLTINKNRIVHNDLACQPQGPVDDCGEGLHLDAVKDSKITKNYLSGNTGGILLTDGIAHEGPLGPATTYYGPASGNLIAGNRAINNVWDCGITLPSHNDTAVSSNGDTGGVFGNTIVDNVAKGNGTADGEGAGILIAAPFPGMAAYDNVIKRNHLSGNGLAGVTIHSHADSQDVDGNQIIGNIIGTNALGQVGANSPGDGDFDVAGTIGILVGSKNVDVSGTVIKGNVIQNNQTAIWTTGNVSGDFSKNHFAHDGVAVHP